MAARVVPEKISPPAGTLIYTSEGRKKDATDTVRVKRSFFRHEERYPLVVLINGGTASAAELVAGALQDHDRAIIVGRPSFGKALLMKPIRLTDGSVLMLVVGHVRTPCGRVIQRSYRGLALRDYYTRALAPRDTAGLPSCRTDAGRTVFGGGGISFLTLRSAHKRRHRCGSTGCKSTIFRCNGWASISTRTERSSSR